nr:uncharacterized protein LOC127484907 isoform X2 [Oryctolagus cuniculus]
MIHSKREALLYPLAGKIEGGSPRTRAPAAECRLPAEAGSGAARKRPCAIRRWKHPALPEDLVRAPTGSCGRLQHPVAVSLPRFSSKDKNVNKAIF